MSNLQKKDLTVTHFWITTVFHQSPREKQGLALTDLTTLTALRDDQQVLVSITSVHLAQKYKQPELLSVWNNLATNQTHHFITGNICPAARYRTKFSVHLNHHLLPKNNTEKVKLYVLYVALFMTRSVWVIWSVTLLFDLSDLSHCLLEDGTFVRFDIKAVDVGEVGWDELSQLFDVLALLFPPTLVTPARAPKGLDMLPWQPHFPMSRPYAGHTAGVQML